MVAKRAAWLAMATLAIGCLAGPRHRRAVDVRAEPARTATERAVASVSQTQPPRSVELVADATPTDLVADAPPLPSPAATGTFASGTGPATTYGAMDGATCEATLRQRAVPFVRVPGGARGVDRPIRLAGRLHGVEFHSMLAQRDRGQSPYEILDCRLALALDDLSAILAAHDVVEAIHYSMYRPPGKSADLSKPKSQHEGAMAIDLAILVKRDGTKLSVLADWHGGIGQRTCGAGAGPSPATKAALELRGLLCEVAQRRIFNVILTPNFNKPHANHFHLEVTKGVKWFLLH